MSLDVFRARYPEFDDPIATDTIVTTHLTECATLLSADKYGSKYQQALFLLTAHELELINLASKDPQIIASRSIEGGSVSFKDLSTNYHEEYYSKTTYGKKYLMLKRTVRFVGFVCV
jgi:hypothetical protein